MGVESRTAEDRIFVRDDVVREVVGLSKNCFRMDSQAFEKFENAIFFKIFKIPSSGQLV